MTIILHLADTIEINAKTLTDEQYVFKVEPSENVHKVKTKVQEKEDIPPEHQRLVYIGQSLKDDLTLFSYNIQHGSTICHG